MQFNLSKIEHARLLDGINFEEYVDWIEVGDFTYLTGWALTAQVNSDVSSSIVIQSFIAKFNGSSLVFNYFISTDEGVDIYTRGVNVDTEGNIYLSGHTEATDLPTFNEPFGNTDCFLLQLNEDGMLLGGVYIGGSDDDLCVGRPAFDSIGDVYLGGRTLSTDLPNIAKFPFGKDPRTKPSSKDFYSSFESEGDSQIEPFDDPVCFVSKFGSDFENKFSVYILEEANSDRVCNTVVLKSDPSWIDYFNLL